MYKSIESGTYKVLSGKYLKPLTVKVFDKAITVRFPFDRNLVTEIKSFGGARWNPDNKEWTVPNNQRSRIRLQILASGFKDAAFQSPFSRYDAEPPRFERKARFHWGKSKEIMPYEHQWQMAEHAYGRHYSLIAGEMGVGKSLSVIIAMERAYLDGISTFWYVGPRSAVKAVERELIVWGCKIRPEMMTYEELTKRAKGWQPGQLAPEFLWLDESSRIKNHSTQRSQAAKQIADGVRDDHGDDGFVILTSGSPAPKAPSDWWHQCEVAYPGFLKEGDIYKFRNRLGIIIQKENKVVGGVYPHLVGWRDNDTMCNVCGQPADSPIHDNHAEIFGEEGGHVFEKGINEVAKLYRRMKGLVIVRLKKDCLDLPEKRFELIEVKPSPSLLRAAKIIASTSPTTIEGLTLLRELSDGFQYIKTATGETECPLCKGQKTITQPEEVPKSCEHCRDLPEEATTNEYENRVVNCPTHDPEYVDTERPCPHCGGSGEVTAYSRNTKEITCPKDDILKSLLEAHEESGRFIIFAGFQGSIDRCVRICHQQGWHVIRVDGRGWQFTAPNGSILPEKDHLSIFQDRQSTFPKVSFVGHPASGGMGVTLTASHGMLFYSNTFNAEDRIQAMDRHHRPGMDVNRGATVYDIIHLPTDRKVLDNLQRKQDLQAMSMGELTATIEEAEKLERVA